MLSKINQARKNKYYVFPLKCFTYSRQIHKNRNDVPFEQWVEMDLDYIQNRTFPGDILIMLKTPIVMLSATGR